VIQVQMLDHLEDLMLETRLDRTMDFAMVMKKDHLLGSWMVRMLGL